MGSKTVSIAGWYGAQNVGDEAVLVGIVGQLRRFLDDPQIGVFSGDPADTHARYGLEAFYSLPDAALPWLKDRKLWQRRNVLWPGFKQLSRSDAVLIGGGGIIADHHPGQLDGQLWRIGEALKRSPVVVTYGVGIEPMQSAQSGAKLKAILDCLAMVAVRDQESADELAKWGIRDNVVVAADPALTIEPDEGGLPEAKRNKLDDHLLICPVHRFKGDHLQRYGELHRDALIKMQTQTQEKGGELLKIRLAPMFPADDCLAPYLEGVPGYAGLEPLYDLSPAAVVAAFARSKLVLSTRLHGAILGLAAGARVVPVCYDIKVKSFSRLAGLSELMAEFGDGVVWNDVSSSAQELAEKLIKALDSAPVSATRLVELRNQADLQAARLADLLS